MALGIDSRRLAAIVCSIILAAISSGALASYGTQTDSNVIREVGRIHDIEVNEASGLAASQRHKDVLYTHNDSGGRARIYALNSRTGRVVARLDINQAVNNDWEDIAVGPGPGGHSYIYIGDIGGNVRTRGNAVYRLREPAVIQDSLLEYDAVLRFQWDEDNAETLMVDELGDVFVVSKVKPLLTPRLYQLPAHGWQQDDRVVLDNGSAVNIFHSTEGPVAGDISPNGQEVLIKTYNILYYWRRLRGESLPETLQREPSFLRCHTERQGEAVCWDAEGIGYYTLSEGKRQPLYYYTKAIPIERNSRTLQSEGIQVDLDVNAAAESDVYGISSANPVHIWYTTSTLVVSVLWLALV